MIERRKQNVGEYTNIRNAYLFLLQKIVKSSIAEGIIIPERCFFCWCRMSAGTWGAINNNFQDIVLKKNRFTFKRKLTFVGQGTLVCPGFIENYY